MIKLNYIYIVGNLSLSLVHVINEKFIMISFQIGET